MSINLPLVCTHFIYIFINFILSNRDFGNDENSSNLFPKSKKALGIDCLTETKYRYLSKNKQTFSEHWRTKEHLKLTRDHITFLVYRDCTFIYTCVAI